MEFNDNASVIVKGSNVFVAGVRWELLKKQEENKQRRVAGKYKATDFTTYRYSTLDGESRLLLGCFSTKSISQSLPTRIKGKFSIALKLIPMLGRGGMAIYPISDNLYGFVSSVNGVLMNDIVGNRDVIINSLDVFRQFHEDNEPESGWNLFAPAEFGIDGSKPLDLDSLLKPPHSDEVLFKTVSRRKQIIAIIFLAFCIFIAYYLWMAYCEREARIAKARAAAAAAQVHPIIVEPWRTIPGMHEFISECARHWQSAHISLGWRFTEAECVWNQPQGEGRIRFAYHKMPGVTVGDFSKRVNQVYNGTVTPFFNLPGNGDMGGFSQSVECKKTKGDDVLPDVNTQLQRLTTFAQQTRIKYLFKNDDNHFISADGVETALPWHSINFSLSTSIPPTLLFKGFDDSGVRLNSIKMKLNSGRITYFLEGELYAK